MKRQAGILWTLMVISCEAGAHGSHFGADGLVFSIDPANGALDIRASVALEIKSKSEERVTKQIGTSNNDLTEMRLGRQSASEAKRDESVSSASTGQVFAVVSDRRRGEYTMILPPIRAYASHDGLPGHHATPIGDRVYYDVPNRVVSGADWIEIRRATDSGDVLLKKLEFGPD